MRTPMIAGNWKMNKTPAETKALIEDLKKLENRSGAEVVVCPMTVCLAAAAEALKGSHIHLGAQNVHFADKGAYTGEASAAALKELGVEYVIIGHSERRQYFGETDVTVNQRTLKALEAGLKPIVCVGESLEQKQQGVTNERSWGRGSAGGRSPWPLPRWSDRERHRRPGWTRAPPSGRRWSRRAAAR